MKDFIFKSDGELDTTSNLEKIKQDILRAFAITPAMLDGTYKDPVDQVEELLGIDTMLELCKATHESWCIKHGKGAPLIDRVKAIARAHGLDEERFYFHYLWFIEKVAYGRCYLPYKKDDFEDAFFNYYKSLHGNH